MTHAPVDRSDLIRSDSILFLRRCQPWPPDACRQRCLTARPGIAIGHIEGFKLRCLGWPWTLGEPWDVDLLWTFVLLDASKVPWQCLSFLAFQDSLGKAKPTSSLNGVAGVPALSPYTVEPRVCCSARSLKYDSTRPLHAIAHVMSFCPTQRLDAPSPNQCAPELSWCCCAICGFNNVTKERTCTEIWNRLKQSADPNFPKSLAIWVPRSSTPAKSIDSSSSRCSELCRLTWCISKRKRRVESSNILYYLECVERKCIDAPWTCSSKTFSVCLSIIVEMDGIESVATWAKCTRQKYMKHTQRQNKS